MKSRGEFGSRQGDRRARRASVAAINPLHALNKVRPWGVFGKAGSRWRFHMTDKGIHPQELDETSTEQRKGACPLFVIGYVGW